MKKHLSTIIISLLIGILIFYIQPLLTLTGNKVIEFFILTSNFFSSYYYSKIGYNDPNIFSTYTFYFINLTLILGFYVGYKFVVYKREKWIERTKYELKKIEKIIDNLKYPEKYKKQEKSLEEDLNDLNEQSNILRKRLENGKPILLLKIVLSLQALFLISHYIFLLNISSQNVEFRNTTIYLMPYVGKEKIDLLKSEWYSMKNKKDYENVMNDITNLNNSITK